MRCIQTPQSCSIFFPTFSVVRVFVQTPFFYLLSDKHNSASEGKWKSFAVQFDYYLLKFLFILFLICIKTYRTTISCTKAIMSENQSETTPTKEGEHKTPVKRTPSKRMSIIEKAQKESEELIKNMGGSLDVEGGRRTRSSVRGTAISTPPPAKKAKLPSATPRRGRQKKGENAEANSDNKTEKDETTQVNKSGPSDTSDEKSKVENCKENDIEMEGNAEESQKSEGKNIEEQKSVDKTDAATSETEKTEEKIDEGKLETINEEAEDKKDNKENNQEEKEKNIPDDNVTSEEQKKDEAVPAAKVDSIKPMEVDGTSGEGEAKDVNSSTEALSNSVQNLKDEKEAGLHKNSIENSSESPATEKAEESKTGNDIREPKISSPTNPADVVAAQPCN